MLGRAPPDPEPDRMHGLVTDVEQPMRRRGVERDGIAGPEHVDLRPDTHLQATADDEPELLSGVAMERVLGAGRPRPRT